MGVLKILFCFLFVFLMAAQPQSFLAILSLRSEPERLWGSITSGSAGNLLNSSALPGILLCVCLNLLPRSGDALQAEPYGIRIPHQPLYLHI